MGVAREFLRQCQRRRVLGVGAADLDDAFKVFDFGLQAQRATFPDRATAHHAASSRRDMHRSRERIVGGLTHVAVIVGMHRIL